MVIQSLVHKWLVWNNHSAKRGKCQVCLTNFYLNIFHSLLWFRFHIPMRHEVFHWYMIDACVTNVVLNLLFALSSFCPCFLFQRISFVPGSGLWIKDNNDFVKLAVNIKRLLSKWSLALYIIWDAYVIWTIPSTKAILVRQLFQLVP